MFLGRYEHTIDEKGRMTIPARFRELLENGAFITLGFDQNLMVLTADRFERMHDRLKKLSVTDPLARQLMRHIFGNAEQIEVDKAGRILIPAFFRENNQFEGSVVVVGVGDYFEIWAPGGWNVQKSQMESEENNTARFTALNLSIE